MEQQYQLTSTAKLQTLSNKPQENLLKSSRVLLSFNLYDNRFIHEKFLDQIFVDLIENKQMIRYDFQRKIYSLYPENYYTNFKVFSKLKALSILSLIYLLLKYVRYKKLLVENYVFLKIYLKALLKIFHLRSSLIFLLLRKNLTNLLMQLCKTYKNINKLVNIHFMSIILINLDYKIASNKGLSKKSYTTFYNSYSQKPKV
uniref:Uncharacterized protein n=1 Tax=Nannochloropsis oceanica TaxID=145522 RepID=A0A023PLQ7_9STRA|nr:hypothetical protein Naon00017 [Nannochloropsis oceanica]